MKDKSSFWLNLKNFFGGLWGVFRHAIFSYVTGSHNRIVYISGEKVTLVFPNSSKAELEATIAVLTGEIERHARGYPFAAERLKRRIKLTAMNSYTKHGSNAQDAVLKPFIKNRYPKHEEKPNEQNDHNDSLYKRLRPDSTYHDGGHAASAECDTDLNGLPDAPKD